ncbi:PaaI family thioesterase [Minwuia thermotolerans]|uniref:Phenylacetic acid degradation protein n=1 Tax=Minwuia thermotolerans TaxID=2056226 RepID=A0A2M9G0I9_9PROT|nr:PaaI family thioesterase [Minwuia thermotolerans]PJK29194.1 phenylacetic acid degradation protein [Minwuia thermotolerans]
MSDELRRMVSERMTPFGALLGIEFITVEPDLVEAEMLVKPEFCTNPAIMHGGAVMALADNVGAVATVINLPPDTTTTTLESKTNFIAAVPVNQKALARCVPVHKGRTTMVWTTTITREDGRKAAVVTQTQMVLPKRD